MYPQLKVMHIQYRQVGKKNKPQGTQREKHTRITKKTLTFVNFVKTLVPFVVSLRFVIVPLSVGIRFQ